MTVGSRNDEAFTRPSQESSAPMSRRERARLKRQARWQRRVDRYEARRAGPPPPRYIHRAVIMIVMLLMMLGLLYLLIAMPGAGPH